MEYSLHFVIDQIQYFKNFDILSKEMILMRTLVHNKNKPLEDWKMVW